MDVTQFILIAVTLFVSSVAQGAVGFASGLLTIPLLQLAGVPLAQAISVNLVASALQNVFGAWRLRGHVPWRRTPRPLAIRLTFVPLGAWALAHVSVWEPARVKQLIGALILGLVAAQLFARGGPRAAAHWCWELLAFAAGGFLLGFCGMGGPPLVLWVLAQGWTGHQSRAFLFFQFAASVPVQAALLYAAFGNELLAPALWALLGLPMVFAGMSVGLWIGQRAPRRRLTQAAYVVLALVALSAIAEPWLSAWVRGGRLPSPAKVWQNTSRTTAFL